MTKLLQTLSTASGKGGRVDALVIQTTDIQDALMEAYLEALQKQNNDPNRKKYSLQFGHNCGTLICDTLNAAGKKPNLPQRFLNGSTPSSIFEMLWSLYQDSQAVSYDPKTKVTSTITYDGLN